MLAFFQISNSITRKGGTMAINYAEGKILIATSQITGNLFNKSVIYVHTDDDTGTIGVMLNVPMDDKVARKWAGELGWNFPERIYHGGPVERQLGYVIHSNDYVSDLSLDLNGVLSYTGGKHIVADINSGMGPEKFLLVTGYCQWQPRQLEDEVNRGMWMVVPFDDDYLFQDLDREHGWAFSINVAAQNVTTDLLDAVNV